MFQIGWHVPVAWAVNMACAGCAVFYARSTRELAAPPLETLLAQLLGADAVSVAPSERARLMAIADLNERLKDVTFELGLLPARLRALARIALASGTGIALFGYIGASSEPALLRGIGFVACVGAGLCGTGIVVAVGRVAKAQSSAIREGWDRVSRRAAHALGTSLSEPEFAQRPRGGA